MSNLIFYVVWNEHGQSPKIKHPNADSAEREAGRLAQDNPGYTFHVLKCVGSCRKNVVDWFYKDPTEFIPF